jgi:hypothetical protein
LDFCEFELLSLYYLSLLAQVAPPTINLSFVIDSRIMYINGEPAHLYGTYPAFKDILLSTGVGNNPPGGVYYPHEGALHYLETLFGLNPNRTATFFIAKDSEAPFYEGDVWLDSWYPYAILNTTSFMLVPFVNDTIENPFWIGMVVMHELGHIFNHGDEYYNTNYCQSSPLTHSRSIEAGAPTTDDTSHGFWDVPQFTTPPYTISRGNHQGCNFHSSKHDSLMNSLFLFLYPFDRPILSWYSRASWGWGNTAAVRARVTGLPEFENFSGSLNISGKLRSNAVDHFTYVVSGQQTIQVTPKTYTATSNGKTYSVCVDKYVVNIQGSGYDVEGPDTNYFYTGINFEINEGKVHEFVFHYKEGRCLTEPGNSGPLVP